MKTKTKTGALPNSAGFPGTNMVNEKAFTEGLIKGMKKSFHEKMAKLPTTNHYIYW